MSIRNLLTSHLNCECGVLVQRGVAAVITPPLPQPSSDSDEIYTENYPENLTSASVLRLFDFSFHQHVSMRTGSG